MLLTNILIYALMKFYSTQRAKLSLSYLSNIMHLKTAMYCEALLSAMPWSFIQSQK